MIVGHRTSKVFLSLIEILGLIVLHVCESRTPEVKCSFSQRVSVSCQWMENSCLVSGVFALQMQWHKNVSKRKHSTSGCHSWPTKVWHKCYVLSTCTLLQGRKEFYYMAQAAHMGKMKQILRFDSPPARSRWIYLAHSGLPVHHHS